MPSRRRPKPPEPASPQPSWREFWPLLRPYRARLAASGVCLLVFVPLVQVHPLIWRYVVDHVLANRRADLLVLAVAATLAAQILGAGLQALQAYLLEKTGQAFVRDTRNAVFARLSRQTLRYHHDQRTGDLVARVVGDVEAMEDSVLRRLGALAEEAFTFVLVAGIVVWLQPVLGLCALAPLAVSFLLIRRFGQRVKTVYEGIRQRVGDIGASLHDRLGGVQLMQGFARRAVEEERFRETTEAHYVRSVRAIALRALFFPAVGAFGFASSVVMLGLGTWFIWRGEFTVGGLIAYRGYWWRLQSPVTTLAQATDLLYRARAAAGRVLHILREPIEIADAPGAVEWTAPRRGEVAWRNVSFRYPGGTTLLLQHVNLRVGPGEFVAFAGRSGAGKTTLLNLVPRFYEPTTGTVLVDGRPVDEYTLDSLRAGLGLVSQETYLFNATIEENLRYAAPHADRAAVEAAARAAHADAFIAALPAGYDTIVGERGVKLSGGQRQRLSLARAFLADPAVLLLDEPTSAVEPESEEHIHRSLRELSRGRTTLLVTHRVSLLRRAPRIVFLADGHVVGDSAHAELLSTCPAYAQAYARWEAEERRHDGRTEAD